jgi:hypothetical protein
MKDPRRRRCNTSVKWVSRGGKKKRVLGLVRLVSHT